MQSRMRKKEERIPIGQAMFDELFPFFYLSLANCCPTTEQLYDALETVAPEGRRRACLSG